MIFLTRESDLSYSSGLLYFYSSEHAFPLGEMMFRLISKLDNSYDITCIDLFYFKKMYKRFDIEEIPTILVIKDGAEIKRINGIPLIKDIDNILKKD